MADYDSSLPVRTEDDGDIVVFISDATTPAQKLAVEADGSINVNDNGGSITVDSVDLDIRDLVFATDKVDASGSEVSLDAATLAALESITVSATDLDIRDLVFATDKVDVSGSEVSLDAGTLAALESITVENGAGAAAVNIQDGGNSITVDAIDLDIRDLDAASDSVAAHLFDEAGVAFSAANPLPVSLQDGSGTEINNYNTGAAIASAATSNHDYTVPGGNDFLLKRVLASASSKMKIEIQLDTGAGFNTIAVGFNSTATPNIMGMEFAPVQLVAGNVVRVIRTNKDNQAQDLYSTIVGVILD